MKTSDSITINFIYSIWSKELRAVWRVCSDRKIKTKFTISKKKKKVITPKCRWRKKDGQISHICESIRNQETILEWNPLYQKSAKTDSQQDKKNRVNERISFIHPCLHFQTPKNPTESRKDYYS